MLVHVYIWIDSSQVLAPQIHNHDSPIFVAVFLGCTSTGRVGLCFLWFYVQELPKAQPVVVLVLKRLRRRGNGLKSHPTDWEKPGIEPATPGLQDIGLSPTPRRLLNHDSPIRFSSVNNTGILHPVSYIPKIFFISMKCTIYSLKWA